MTPVFKINGYDYARYLKHKTGLQWERENTNDKDAGRNTAAVMDPMVTSHQRVLTVKMGPMPFNIAQQLERALENGDAGVSVQYPDLKDGICTRLFYNTSISSAIEQFTDDDIVIDNISFKLITIKEDVLT